MRYSKRILADDRAEDVVQHTFIRAYEAISAGQQAQNLRAWLFRVAHNAALDSLKDRSLTHVELDESINGVERPDQAFERREGLREVVAAVNGLPSRQRDAIVLRELEGRSYEEIAREMGVSGGAVRQLLTRARTTLRAGATALTPYSLLSRVPMTHSEPFTARVAEMVGGAGAPVMVAQVCAVAIVTCAGVGDLREESSPSRDAPARAIAAAAVPDPSAVPALQSPAAPGGVPAPAAVHKLVPPAELPVRAEAPAAPAPEQTDGDPVKTVKTPALPPSPKVPDPPPPPQPLTGYDFAYPVGLADPVACQSRRRGARASCEDEILVTDEQAATDETAGEDPAAGEGGGAPAAEPPPAEPSPPAEESTPPPAESSPPAGESSPAAENADAPPA